MAGFPSICLKERRYLIWNEMYSVWQVDSGISMFLLCIYMSVYIYALHLTPTESLTINNSIKEVITWIYLKARNRGKEDRECEAS